MPLRVWNCNAHVIHRKLEKLVDKVARIKEESKLMSVVIDWLEYDANNVKTPAFGDLTQAFARHQLPSIQSVITGGTTREGSLENCVNNLNLNHW